MLPVNGEGNVSGDTTVRSPVVENTLPDEIVPFGRFELCGTQFPQCLDNVRNVWREVKRRIKPDV